MQGKTRSHKSGLELGLKKSSRKKNISKIREVLEVEIRLESCMNVETSVSPVKEDLEVDTQIITMNTTCFYVFE